MEFDKWEKARETYYKLIRDRQYQGKWICLEADMIIAVADSYEELVKKVKNPEKYIIHYVPTAEEAETSGEVYL